MVAFRGRPSHVAGAALVLALATACGPADDEDLPPVTRNQVIGHWKGDCAGTGATLDLAADGTVSATKFLVHTNGIENEPQRVDGAGEWYLFKGVEGVTPQTLDLKLGNRIQSLDYVRDGSELRLRLIVDPDAGLDCNFEKAGRRPAQPTS
ncbi:hypothetical protein PV367_37540 [Streptomyces europaeiscabiei]|uniref:Lipoprotein n=1 Tax=Streptomyces europaeiscabiei TaxID=146819 RepID=A0AAJ2PXT2_9ACTN|nr:hypothetical protein [Streptomyces europaeiscabiei]MDX3135372.1 hypothetical protein [Streptomyces europaeiscabiei]